MTDYWNSQKKETPQEDPIPYSLNSTFRDSTSPR